MPGNSKPICVDASLALRLVLGGPHQEEIEQFWQEWIEEGVTLIAPQLFTFEVTSVVRQHVFFKRVSLQDGKKALEGIFDLGVGIKHTNHLQGLAWDFAHRFNQPTTYDTAYVALAHHFKCEFWTVDKKLYKTLHSKLLWVKSIE